MFSFRKSTAAHDTRSNFMGILKHSVKVIIWSNDTGKSKWNQERNFTLDETSWYYVKVILPDKERAVLFLIAIIQLLVTIFSLNYYRSNIITGLV